MSITTPCTPLLSQIERDSIISLINREVIPAIGCTEPIAVSLCVARATELLQPLFPSSTPAERFVPDHVSVKLSSNILKNAMGVGIPGTGMIGLPIAVALGALIGRSELKLEVLADTTPDHVERGKQFIKEKRVLISLKEDLEESGEKLYIEAFVEKDSHHSLVIISGGHTNFKYLSLDDQVIFDSQSVDTNEGNQHSESSGNLNVELNLKKIWDFATTSPVDELKFILEAKRMNKAASDRALQGNFGHCVGKIMGCSNQKKVMGDSIFSHILCKTGAACDARMAGAMIPVMSNSGSGNQGIAATMPIVVFAEETNSSEEQLIRSLALSHLTVIYIKQSLGRLSALCGCVAAATGSSCGIVYLMGGSLVEVSSAVKNMIANLTGMICDGAKPSCAMKVASGVSTAVLSAMMAMENKCVTSEEGIIEDDVDKCIRNLTRIGRDGMNETDKLVLSIMTHKCC